MKTLGEIEAAICQGMSRFEQEYMGRGPKDIHTHLINDLVVVRLQGVLRPPNSIWSSRFRPRRGETCSSKYGPISSKPLGRSW